MYIEAAARVSYSASASWVLLDTLSKTILIPILHLNLGVIPCIWLMWQHIQCICICTASGTMILLLWVKLLTDTD